MTCIERKAISLSGWLICTLLSLFCTTAQADQASIAPSAPSGDPITLTPCDPALERLKASDIEVSKDTIQVIAACEIIATKAIDRRRVELPNTLGLGSQTEVPIQLEYAPRQYDVEPLQLSVTRRVDNQSAVIDLIPDYGPVCAQLIVTSTTPLADPKASLLEHIPLRWQMDLACQVLSVESDETIVLLPAHLANTGRLGSLTIGLTPQRGTLPAPKPPRALPLLKPIENHPDWVLYAPCGNTKSLPSIDVRVGPSGDVMPVFCVDRPTGRAARLYKFDALPSYGSSVKVLRDKYSYSDLAEDWRIIDITPKENWTRSVELLDSDQKQCARVSFKFFGKNGYYPKRFYIRPQFWFDIPNVKTDKNCDIISIQILDRIGLVKGKPNRVHGKIYGVRFAIERALSGAKSANLEELSNAQP